MKSITLLFCAIITINFAFAQTENLQVEGAITIEAADNATPPKGTIQWDGTSFQGYGNAGWENLGASFNPGLPTNFVISSVVDTSLTAGADSYTVPAGFNLYITDLRGGATNTIKKDAVTADFSGFGSYLQQHITMALGENMSISNATVDLNINGFLTPAKTEFIVQNLPYTVEPGKTLYILTYSFQFGTIQINMKDHNSARVIYGGQTISGTGKFIGYLK